MKYLSALTTDARGSIDGITGSRNTFSRYFRARVSPVNVNTIAQQLVRTRLTTMSQSWGGITEVLRQNWIDVAASWTNTNVFNQEIGYTGFSLFGRLNRNRQEINEALLTTAPLPTEVDGMTALTIVADTTGGTLDATFTPAIAADHKVVVRATRPVTAGTNFVKTEFRKIAVLDSTDTSPIDLAAFYIAVFGALPPIGGKVFVDFKPVLIANGQNAVPLKAVDIAI